MKLATDIARLAAWASLTVLFVLLSAVVYSARNVLLHADGVLTRAEAVESKVNASAVNLDRATAIWAGAAEHQAQTIDVLVFDTRATLAGVRTVTQTASAQLEHVAPVLDQAKATIAGAGQDAHRVSMDAGVVMGSADSTLRAARPVLANAAQAEADLDALVTSADLKATLGNVQRASGNVADGTAEAAVIVRDARGSWILRLLGFGRKEVKR